MRQTWSFGAQRSSTEWGNAHGGWNGSGNCFIRTKQLTDPKSWRGWSGRGEWNVSFVDPYNDPAGSFVPEEHVCTPVLSLGCECAAQLLTFSATRLGRAY